MSFLSDLIFGVRTLLADNGEAPQRSTAKFVGATYTDDPANNQTVITFTGTGAVPIGRSVLTGAGLAGGGTLGADRTLSVLLRGQGVGTPSQSGMTFYGQELGIFTSNGLGLRIIPGQGLAVKPSLNGGLDVGSFGADATSADYGVGIKFLSTGGFTCDAASGLAIKLPAASGLVRDATGLYVDATKVAALVSGKTTAAQARGQTLMAPVGDTSDATISVTGVLNASGPTFKGVARDTGGTRVLTGSVSVQAGDVVDLQAFVNSAPAAANFDVYIRLSSGSTMASPGTIYAEQHVSGTSSGGGVSLFETWTAAVTATLTWSVVVAKYSAVANFNIAQRNAVLKTFRA